MVKMGTISSDYLKTLIESVDRLDVMKKYLESFYYECKVKNLTLKTVNGYAERLGNFYRYIQGEGIPFEKVDKEAVKRYILSLQGKVSDITINGRLRVLRLFWNYLCSEGLWNGSGSPMDGIKLIRCEKKYPQILTLDDMEKVLAVPNKRTFTGYRNYLMLLIFWDSMIRLGELITLKVSDVDLKAGMIRVYGKGRKERMIPLGSKCIKAIHHYLIKFGEGIPGDILICKSDGGMFTNRAIQQILERIGNKAGVKLNPHKIRHSSGTLWVKRGGSSSILQKLLGHTTQRTTELYIHLAGADTKEWMDRYSPGNLIKV